MTLLMFALCGAIDACPKVWIVDMSVLPARAFAEYRVTVYFEGSNTSFGLTWVLNKGAEPDDLQALLYISTFTRKRWVVEEQGLEVMFWSVNGAPAQRIWVASNGPAPAVRWQFALPKK